MRIYMQYNDMEQGIVRFYQLALQQDLLGSWLLLTESGIQGHAGRITKKQFDNFETAEAELTAARDRQISKGYKVVFIRAMHQLP